MDADTPWVRAVRKPNSVSRRNYPRRGDDHASSPTVARRVKRPTRKLGQAALSCFPIWSCSMRGLPCPEHHCPGGALLPHLFTLTAPSGERRSIFCGTFLPVTRTGRYPAHCLKEFGLSARSRRSRRPSERLEPRMILAVGCPNRSEPPYELRKLDAETNGRPFTVSVTSGNCSLDEFPFLPGQVVTEMPGQLGPSISC